MDSQSYPSLHVMLDAVARRRSEHIAIEDPPDGSISYGSLAELSDRVRDRLVAPASTSRSRSMPSRRSSGP
jgi:hypothetical protein